MQNQVSILLAHWLKLWLTNQVFSGHHKIKAFRAVCVDAVVLKFCSGKELEVASFGQTRDQGIQLERSVVKQFIRSFEERLNASIQHPHNGELNVDMRQVIDGQVLQLVHIVRLSDDVVYVPCVFRG
jgi:CRISPR/Cas system-associated endonuclease Cas1